MTSANTPTWRSPNLKRHHHKHCVKGRDCFKDVLGSAFSATEDEYRDASEKAFQKAYIQYEGSEKERGTPDFYEKCHHRIDGRSLKTTSDLESEKPRYFRTCYHVHYGKPHNSQDLKKSELDQVMKYLEKLEDDGAQGLIRNYKIQTAKSAQLLELRDLSQLAREINRLNNKM